MAKWVELTTQDDDRPIMINFDLATNFYALSGGGTRIDFNDEEFINVVETYSDVRLLVVGYHAAHNT